MEVAVSPVVVSHYGSASRNGIPPPPSPPAPILQSPMTILWSAIESSLTAQSTGSIFSHGPKA